MIHRQEGGLAVLPVDRQEAIQPPLFKRWMLEPDVSDVSGGWSCDHLDQGHKRQRDDETRASSHLAFYGNRATVCTDDPFHNRESQSTAAPPCLPARSISSVEALKDMWEVFSCNTDASIADGQADFGWPLLDSYPDV